MIRRNRFCLLVIFLFVTLTVSAQEFALRAAIDSVRETGFYKIAVSPQLSAFAKADLSDVRMADEKGTFVPYIIRSREPRRSNDDQSTEMQILSNTTEKNYTTVVLRSAREELKTAISLKLNNASVERYAQVSGSNNNEDWFIIDDHIMLERAPGSNTGTYAQEIRFPGNRYQFFKLKINNAHTDPLNIIAASEYHSENHIQAAPGVIVNPTSVVKQKDSSDRSSYITIRNASPYMTNAVELTLSGARFYERNVVMYILPNDNDSNALNYAVANFTISSSRPTVLNFPGQKAQAILLVIENKDNPPLKIEQVTTRQEQLYLVAWLDRGRQYSLLAASEKALTPAYDLSRFTDSIPTQVPVLSLGVLSAFSHETLPVAQKQKEGFPWLWTIIIVSVFGLSLLTYRLMREVKRGDG